MIENEKLQSGLYADWSEAPQNIPLTREYFECSNHFVFDDTIFEEEEENGKN